jgi:hypothetical protein
MSGKPFPRAATGPAISRVLLNRSTRILGGLECATGSGPRMFEEEGVVNGVPLMKQENAPRVWGSRVTGNGMPFPRAAIGPRISRLTLIRSTRILDGSTGVTGSGLGMSTGVTAPGLEMFTGVTGVLLRRQGNTLEA